jgi:hypothetical protein
VSDIFNTYVHILLSAERFDPSGLK